VHIFAERSRLLSPARGKSLFSFHLSLRNACLMKVRLHAEERERGGFATRKFSEEFSGDGDAQISFILSFITYFVLSYDKIAVESIKSPDVSPGSTQAARLRRVIGRSINLAWRARKEEFRRKGSRYSRLYPVGQGCLPEESTKTGKMVMARCLGAKFRLRERERERCGLDWPLR